MLFNEEALHGLEAAGATSFPQAIALASTWNTDLVQRVFTAAAAEARARGVGQVLAPVVDIAREPRWGRLEETYGEDPYLTARMGVAAVRGFQGTDSLIGPQHVFATLKHMTGHSQPESGTNVGPASIGERTLRDMFLYPFEVAIKEGGARSVMPSYNEIDGIPSHANRWMLRGNVSLNDWTQNVGSDSFADPTRVRNTFGCSTCDGDDVVQGSGTGSGAKGGIYINSKWQYNLTGVYQIPIIETSLGAISDYRDQGTIRHVGISNVTVDQLRQAQEIVPIVSVQNRYNLVERNDEDVLEACERQTIGFIPWFPLKTGQLAKGSGPVAQIAKAHDAGPAQVALAWLLAHSPVMLPIPGTGSVEHLEENIAAAHLHLMPDEVEALNKA